MKISEVSKLYHITPDTLRYYEKIGLIDPIHKDQSGNRRYTPDDLLRIKFIKRMRSAGLSLKLIMNYLSMDLANESAIINRKQILIDQKSVLEAKLQDLVDTIDYLNYKINHYDKKLGQKKC